MPVNRGVIIAELERVANSDSFKRANKDVIQTVLRGVADEALGLLIKCLNNAVSETLEGSAIAAVGEADGAITESSGSRFVGDVYFPNNVRPSLYPEKYGAVISMAQLLNNGYSARGRVYGIWHGHETSSLQERAGAHFVSNGVSDFNGNYAADYNAHAEVSGGFD